MKKKIIYFFLLVFTMTAAQAAPMVSTQGGTSSSGGYNINIPQSARGLVQESDLVEMFCYEAKYQGGIAIATVESVDEAINEKISTFEEVGVTVDLTDVLSLTGNLRSSMNAICEASSLDQAQERAEEFKEESYKLKEELEINLMAKLKAEIEKQFAEQEEEIRAKFEKELKEEADKLVEEKKAYYEKQVRAEAETEAKKIQTRLQAEIEAEMQAEFGGQENPNIERLMQIGKERGEARAASEAKALEERLRAKYEKIAEDEEAVLRVQMEEKAKEKEAEMRDMYGDFSDVSARIEELKQEKYESEWAKYEDMVNKKKMEIMEKVIEGQFENARQSIEMQRGVIDQVYEANMQTKYRIPSADDLLKQLDRDKENIVAMFADGDYSQAKIESIKKEFQAKWETLRERLDAAKNSVPSEVISNIDKKTDWDNLKNRLSRNQSHMRNVISGYDKSYTYCKQNPTITTNGNRVGDCAKCRLLSSNYKEWVELSKEVDKKIANVLELIKKLDTYKQTTPSLETALSFKDEIQTSLNNLATDEKRYTQVAKDYELAIKAAYQVCASYK